MLTNLRTAAITTTLAFTLTTAALAQAAHRRINPKAARPMRFQGVDVNTADRSLLSGSYNQPPTFIFKSDWQIERERVLAMRQASRDATKERRERTWASLPVKIYSDEDYAKSKFNVARMLWQNGRVESSRRHLEQLINDYPQTDTPERAKVVLARF
jgi:hypothetical protein